jgi:Bacteriophage head to tail connecting protein
MKGPEIRQRFDALVALRSNLDDTLQAIEKYVVPYRGQFFRPQDSEHEVEWRRRQIYDSTAPISCDLLASQIHSNLTSPSIRWFELRFRRDEINDQQAAQTWLQAVQNQIWQTLLESDFNMEIAETYLDLCSFGTAILFEEELSEEQWQGVTFTALPIQDTYFEHGADGKLLRFYRRLKYTNLQMTDKFGEAARPYVLEAKDDVDQKQDVVFCVFRREDVDDADEDDALQRLKPTLRPYGYAYVVHRTGDILEEGGYYEMPAFVARWKKVSGSVWGHSPAFIALSDILQLNEVVAQTSEARAKALDPPLMTTERGIISDLDLTPGGLTMVTNMEELAPLLQGTRFDQADAEIDRLQQSVRSTFFIDKLELKESPAMTATEVMVRYERMQRQFAPTLGRLQADLLDPLIEMTYRVLERNGQLPFPPQGLEREALDIEYTGPIPRAQKNEQAQSISLWIGELAGLAQVMPDILDVPNTDAVARMLGMDRGVPAKLMHSEEEVKATREQRAELQQAAQQAAVLEQMGGAMKQMGEGQQAIQGNA